MLRHRLQVGHLQRQLARPSDREPVVGPDFRWCDLRASGGPVNGQSLRPVRGFPGSQPSEILQGCDCLADRSDRDRANRDSGGNEETSPGETR